MTFQSGLNFIFLDDSANVFIGGDIADSTNGWNFFTLKIKQKVGTKIEQQKSFIPIKYSLKQNYPNPFNNSTTITFEIPKKEFVEIAIYNLMGEKVAELLNKELSLGKYEIPFSAEDLPSGIYFYRIKTSTHQETKKCALLK
ncbi:MAG: T9SS type A sorting domain-containing protein [Bacteroidetes bacterium]|nr:T9SS type A sorting domain-containing protein [Bacteroidota bacterium]MBU1679694.1 T9SS type A sorting domain-containing protein [Bacteroidota bacterium]